MRLYLVRHGETDANYNGIIQGQGGNLQINDHGIEQIKKLKLQLASINFKKCYTSPLIRTWSTAMIIAGDRVEIIEDKRLIERYLGDFEGKDKETYDHVKYWDFKLNSNDGGVEQIKDIFKRCTEFLESIKDKYNDDDNVLIVTHNCIIRTLYHIINKSDTNKKLKDFKIEPGFCMDLEYK